MVYELEHMKGSWGPQSSNYFLRDFLAFERVSAEEGDDEDLAMNEILAAIPAWLRSFRSPTLVARHINFLLPVARDCCSGQHEDTDICADVWVVIL
uniref:Uncharacterized protein n=1 Tax=Parascaris equorum TaxID=6256 RepID=A0A914S0Z0_PAREQ